MKKIYEIRISENPKVGFRLWKKIRATEEVKNKIVRKLKTAYYVSEKEVEEWTLKKLKKLSQDFQN